MAILYWLLALSGLTLLFLLFWPLRKPIRRYDGPASVSWIYDQWTQDLMLEHYWGAHMHAGFYDDPPIKKEFITAKHDMVDEMLRWGLGCAPEALSERFESLERHSNQARLQLLDVGCGLGATMRHLARRWPDTLELTGITLSAAQARRATEISAAAALPQTRFLVGDAAHQPFAPESFDIVWALESEPHIPDKARFLQEMIRLLKPGGILIMGTWNVRDTGRAPLTRAELKAVRFLIDEWNHAAFLSISDYDELFARQNLEHCSSADWARQTTPTWRAAFLEPFRRPAVMLRASPGRFGSIWRDGFTILRYDRAFRQGLLAYGLFCGRKPALPNSSSAKQLAAEPDNTL